MSAPRFYFPPPLPSADIFELPPEAARHASRVLRLRISDPVQVFDGAGVAVNALIHEISGNKVILRRLDTPGEPTPPGLRIVLAQAMCSSEKMDWIVQKATELGAAEIQPVQTQRSVARLTAERAQRRGEHWRGVVIAACEQCGRNTLPQIQVPQEFGTWLAQMRNDPSLKLILQPDGALPLAQHAAPQSSVVLLVGPEGGFSAEEEAMARQAGFVPVLLGPRVLRTETAALAGIAAMQTLWGEFG